MPGLFQGLELGKRALLGHQVALQTIGHNIANVNTPGYTRQRVVLSTSTPEQTSNGHIGTGLMISDISHVRDLFLGGQFREAQKDLGSWSYKQKALQQIEGVFSEPQDGSLNDILNQFWNDWSALSSDAESSGYRSSIIANATQMINGFKHLADSLEGLRRATDRDLEGMTSDVNRITGEIAKLNVQVVRTEADGTNANDLRDMRDRLIDELSSLIDVNTLERPDGAERVYMGSMLLVDGVDSFPVGSVAERVGDEITHRLTWEGTAVSLKNVNGQLAGLIETRDELLPGYLGKLNKMSKALVEQVNALHQSAYGLDGTTGIAFFDPNYTDAGDLRLNQEIVLDKNKIAASDSANPDDQANGVIAAAMSDLRNALVLSKDTATINEYYQSLIGDLGVEAREATSFASNYELVAHQIDNQRQSVEGVSLDEEMTQLIKFQHAFDAAARVITAMDDALDTLIMRMAV